MKTPWDQAIEAELLAGKWGRGRSLAMAMLVLMVMLGSAFFLWAGLARVDEVTIATGQVIPSGKVKLVQSLEGGVLAELMVAEGDLVSEGQVVARIDDTATAAGWRENNGRRLALMASMARLHAEASGAARPRFDNEIALVRPDLVRDETQLFLSRQNELGASLAALQRSRRLVVQELEMARPLVARGALAEVEVLRLERAANDLQGQMDDRRNRFRSDAYDQYARMQMEYQRAVEGEVATKDRLVRTQLKAPIRGLVKRLVVTTVGGVIAPGGVVLEIVPLETGLLVEGRVRPGDIAFVAVGQSASVKIAAYDYSIYGDLPATVTEISPDTLTDERTGETYYRIQARTQREYLAHQEKELPVMPGMTATVDILTGHKTVLDYLLKPLLKVKQSALREK